MANEQTQNPTPPQVEFVRDDDFQALYANNVQAENSIWDMKVIFGLLDQAAQPNKVRQHTSVNLPWAQVKLLSYYLRVSLAFHELQNGKIPIAPSIMPPDPETVGAEAIAVAGPELQEAIKRIYKEFMATL